MSKAAKKTFKVWLRSLGVAAVGGMVAEISAWMFDPHTLFENPKAVAARLLTGAGIALHNYWKAHPISEVWPDEEVAVVVDSAGVPVKTDEGN